MPFLAHNWRATIAQSIVQYHSLKHCISFLAENQTGVIRNQDATPAGTFEQNYGASSMSVRQRDVAAAVKGAVAAGVEVARVEVDKEGRVVIVAGKPSESAAEVSALDAWMATHAR